MKYDLLVILPPKYSETEFPGIIEGVVNYIRSLGAEITSQADLGKQKLAYAIGGDRFGHMLNFKLEADEAVAKKLNEQMRLRQEVIRHMLTKVSERKAAPRRSPPKEKVLEPAVVAMVSAGAEKKEDKLTLEDLDRKLDEILGKESI